MRYTSIALAVLFLAQPTIAKDLTFYWDLATYSTPQSLPHVFSWASQPVQMALNTQNTGYDQSQNSFEVKVQVGLFEASTIFSTGTTKAVVWTPVSKVDPVQASVRALASSSWVCDRVSNIDCDKGVWVSLPNQSAADPNEGYDASKLFYEFRTKKNSESWSTSTTLPKANTITKTVSLVPGDQLGVQIRTLAPLDFKCDRVNVIDCDKSQWVSFASLPSIDTPIVFLASPSSVVVTSNTTSFGGTGLPVQFSYQLNIGTPDLSGSISESNNNYTLLAGGGDVWGTKDTFFFAANPTTLTTTSIVAKIEDFSEANTGDWSKAGIQIRLGTAANAKNVTVLVSKKTSAVSLQYRSSVGGTTREIQVAGISPPIWLKISRATSSFTGSYSSDGVTWTSIGTISTTMSGTTYCGLFGAKNSVEPAPISVIFSQLQGF